MGFSTIEAKVPWGPAFFCAGGGQVRKELAMPVGAAWCI
jgi:hypothetical protein